MLGRSAQPEDVSECVMRTINNAHPGEHPHCKPALLEPVYVTNDARADGEARRGAEGLQNPPAEELRHGTRARNTKRPQNDKREADEVYGATAVCDLVSRACQKSSR